MHARFHIPSNSRLQGYAPVIWEVIGGQDSQEIILPQGIVEIVFNFADRIDGLMPDGRTLLQAPRCFIQGIHTHILQSDYTGRHQLLGVRLHPYRLQALLGIPPSELNNTIVDLTLIRPGFDRLWHRLAETELFEDKVRLLEEELPELSAPVCDRSRRLSDLFLADQPAGFQTVDELARQVCYSTRQLNRVSHHLFGLSAEELTIYKKVIESVKLMHAGGRSLTDVAYSAGFYDQPHFCRVFKSYTGMTPNQYRKQRSPTPFHIIN